LTPVPWQFSHWMPRPAYDADATVMKSFTVVSSGRAHCLAVVAVTATMAAGLGTVALAFGTVEPSWWQRWQL
jgi:hypothetical protein